MKIKKTIALLGSVLLLGQTAGLAACGGDPFDDQQTVAGKYNVTVGYKDSDGGKVVMNALKKAYEEKNPTVNIKLKNYGGTFDEFMNQNWANQSNIPDVLWMPDNEFAGWAKGGYFLDLRSYYEASEETSYDLYYESMLDCASYSGTFKPLTEDDSADYGLYFAPRDYNKIVIAINKDLFSSYNVEIPDTTNGWTMDEFFALCTEIDTKITERVSDGDRTAQNYRAAFFQLSSEVVYTTMFHAMGSEGIIDAKGQVALGNETNSAILDKYYDELTNSNYKLAKGTEVDSIFERGMCFMRTIVRPTAADLAVNLDNLDFLPFPAKKADGSIEIGMGCSGYGISTIHAEETQKVDGLEKKVKDLAWDFIKYVISEEGQEIAGETGMSVPILKSLEQTGAWRSAIGEGLNHDAFIAGEGLVLDTYHQFDPMIRTKLSPHIVAFFDKMSNVNSGSKENRANALKECAEQFEAAKR